MGRGGGGGGGGGKSPLKTTLTSPLSVHMDLDGCLGTQGGIHLLLSETIYDLVCLWLLSRDHAEY